MVELQSRSADGCCRHRPCDCGTDCRVEPARSAPNEGGNPIRDAFFGKSHLHVLVVCARKRSPGDGTGHELAVASDSGCRVLIGLSLGREPDLVA